MQDKFYLECDCHSDNHLICIVADVEEKKLYLSPQVNYIYTYPWWKRFYSIIMYIITGVNISNSIWDTTQISGITNKHKIMALLNFLEKSFGLSDTSCIDGDLETRIVVESDLNYHQLMIYNSSRRYGNNFLDTYLNLGLTFNNKLQWLSRLIFGVKVLFGYTSSFGRWESITLDEDNIRRLYLMLLVFKD